MATYASNSIETIAHLPTYSKEDLRQIWHVGTLQIAKTDEGFWLKGFRHEDVQSADVRSMPNLQLYELSNQFLFKKGNRVPERKLPTGLLWHPIQKALKIELPSFNENLFNVDGILTLSFVSSSTIQKVSASMVELADLGSYVDSVPNHVFNGLHWCIIDGDKAFVIGEKILPVVSERYWKFQELLIPVGYDLKHSFLKQIIVDFKANSSKDEFWIFDSEGQYFSVPKDQLIPLDRASVKTTLRTC